MNIKILDDSGDSTYDMEWKIPDSMNYQDAITKVNTAIKEIKKKEDYTFDDLEEKMLSMGFENCSFVIATEYW